MPSAEGIGVVCGRISKSRGQTSSNRSRHEQAQMTLGELDGTAGEVSTSQGQAMMAKCARMEWASFCEETRSGEVRTKQEALESNPCQPLVRPGLGHGC